MLFDYGVAGAKTAKDVTAIVNEMMDQTLIDEQLKMKVIDTIMRSDIMSIFFRSMAYKLEGR